MDYTTNQPNICTGGRRDATPGSEVFRFPYPLTTPTGFEEEIMMLEAVDLRYINCPACGRVLMKCRGSCCIDITCFKCSMDFLIRMDDGSLVFMESSHEDRKSGNRAYAKVSMKKEPRTALRQ